MKLFIDHKLTFFGIQADKVNQLLCSAFRFLHAGVTIIQLVCTTRIHQVSSNERRQPTYDDAETLGYP